MQLVYIHNQTHPSKKPLQARYCASFLGRLRGLMFQKTIGAHQGLLMVQPRPDRLDAAIHMFFMNFDIAVIWADEHLRVVDVRYARRWRPAYAPARAAKYVLETHPDRLKDFEIGDQLVIDPC
jgi:uncharacterized membrane protein (UPF0127 family)